MTGVSIIDDIIKELTIISHIKEDQKIQTTNGSVIIRNDGYQTGLLRWYKNENREINIAFLEKVVCQTCEIIKEILNSTQLQVNITDKTTDKEILEYKKKKNLLKSMAEKLLEAIPGIENLCKTYHADINAKTKLLLLIQNINREVDEVKNELERLVTQNEK